MTDENRDRVHKGARPLSQMNNNNRESEDKKENKMNPAN